MAHNEGCMNAACSRVWLAFWPDRNQQVVRLHCFLSRPSLCCTMSSDRLFTLTAMCLMPTPHFTNTPHT